MPVLPVVGLAVTGVSSGALAFFGTLARVSTAVILVALVIGIAWLAWIVGRQERPSARPGPARQGRHE